MAEEDFRKLAHRIFTRGDNTAIKDVAVSLGYGYHKLYSRFRGTAAFKPHEIKALIQQHNGPELIEYFLVDTQYFVAPRPNVTGNNVKDIEQGAVHTVLEAVDVLRAVERSMRDQKIDHRDKLEILTEIKEAEGALASLRSLVES